MLTKRKFYTLSDIKKHLVYTPLIFVFVTAIISMVVIVSVLEVKQKNEEKLLTQKEQFEKRNILNQYINDIKFKANSSFDGEEVALNDAVTSLSGFLKYSKNQAGLNDIKSFIQDLEKNSNFEFVIFDKKKLNIIYGEDVINYLQVITDSKIEIKRFQKHMLENILYIGDDNLIYWIDKTNHKIRLSYFKDIENKNWYLGAFSKIDDMEDSIRKVIINSIVQKSKYYSDSYFWFYDYNQGYVYNYYNKGQKLNAKYILEQDRFDSSSQILRKYITDNEVNKSHKTYNFTKYNFLVSIKSYTLPSKLSNLDYKYNSKLSVSIAIVILISLFLILASTVFTKFINSIFHRYNKRLETRNKMYKKWKDRYELAIIASNDGLWDIDLETDNIFFSKKWLEMFGYKKGEIKSLQEWLNIIHQEDRPIVENRLKTHLDGKTEHFISEYRIKNKWNEYKWVLVRGKAFRDKEKNPKRMLMMSMDIERRKRLSKELQYVDLLVEYGRIVIFKWKNDDFLTPEYVSKSISSFGYSTKGFENKKDSFLNFVHKDDAKELKIELKEAIKKDSKSFTKVFRVIEKDGTIRWVFNRTIFLKDDFGNVTHLYGYITDITQMKLTEEELKSKVEEELAKNIEKDRLLVHQSKLAAMGEMLGNIAHQWRQPLNNINLLTHFIRDNFENLKKEDIEDITSDTKLQIDYMSQTIDDFRNFYQPTKDKASFNIKESINSCVKIVETQLEKTDMKVEVLGESIDIISYKNEFQQVILNILNNANDAAEIKNSEENFHAKTKIEIIKEKNNVKILLENNCGEVQEEIMERMFEPYFTTKFEDQGTGIGLYMAKTIIEKNMNGSISAKNIEGGVVFTIILPL
ncbi:PAS domain-containing protein [Halarcobacter sp.]|uniref:PAS domain-containing protein n=1 Tax=Halarcobacter sp. TaxID=2321133 RepID=UPI003A8EFFFC